MPRIHVQVYEGKVVNVYTDSPDFTIFIHDEDEGKVYTDSPEPSILVDEDEGVAWA